MKSVYDRGGGSRKERYSKLVGSVRWQHVRRRQLTSHPMCQACEKEGRSTLACEVHHVIPVESGSLRDMERLCFSPQNLMSVCHSCHLRIHMEMGSRKRDKVMETKRAELDDFCRKFEISNTNAYGQERERDEGSP